MRCIISIGDMAAPRPGGVFDSHHCLAESWRIPLRARLWDGAATSRRRGQTSRRCGPCVPPPNGARISHCRLWRPAPLWYYDTGICSPSCHRIRLLHAVLGVIWRKSGRIRHTDLQAGCPFCVPQTLSTSVSRRRFQLRPPTSASRAAPRRLAPSARLLPAESSDAGSFGRS